LLEKYHIERLQITAKRFEWEAAIRVTESPGFPAKFRATCKDAVNKFEGDEQVVLVKPNDHFFQKLIPSRSYGSLFLIKENLAISLQQALSIHMSSLRWLIGHQRRVNPNSLT
jgi:hypothetical protein